MIYELIRDSRVGRFDKNNQLIALNKGIYSFRCKNTLKGYKLANFKVTLTGTPPENAKKLEQLFKEYKRKQREDHHGYCAVKVTGLNYEKL